MLLKSLSDLREKEWGLFCAQIMMLWSKLPCMIKKKSGFSLKINTCTLYMTSVLRLYTILEINVS